MPQFYMLVNKAKYQELQAKYRALLELNRETLLELMYHCPEPIYKEQLDFIKEEINANNRNIV